MRKQFFINERTYISVAYYLLLTVFGASLIAVSLARPLPSHLCLVQRMCAECPCDYYAVNPLGLILGTEKGAWDYYVVVTIMRY